MSSDRRPGRRPRPASGLRLWRALLVVTTLTATATLAYLPGLPGSAVAETFVGPDVSASPVVEEPTAQPTADATPLDTPLPEATPAIEPTPTSTLEPTPAPTVDLTPTPSVEPPPTPTVESTPEPTPSATASIEASALPSEIPSPVVAPMVMTLVTDRTPGDDGVTRIEPHGSITLTASITAPAAADAVTLTMSIPAGWTVIDEGGGSRDEAASTVAWVIDALTPGTAVSRSVTARAPELELGVAAPAVTFGVSTTQAGVVQVGPSVSVVVAQPVSITHVTAARVARAGVEPQYLAPDQPLLDEPRFEVFRLRFEIVNSGSTDYHWTPTLEWSAVVDGSFVPLPEAAAKPGTPFYAAAEWIRDAGGGTVIGPALDESAGPPPTTRSMGTNPIPQLVIPASQTVVVEFSAAASVDAAYLSTYYLRLTDAGTPIPDGPVFGVTMGSRPQVDLSPGQQNGVPADASTPQPPRIGPFSLAPTTIGFHAPSYDLTSDVCAACHRAHTGSGTVITAEPTDLALCASCHDGSSSGAPNVIDAYAGVPANDATTRSYFRHDPAVADAAYAARPECAECHNPHNSTSTASVPGSSGWSPSGLIGGAPAASVSYGTGSPSYALVARPTLEYQLCLKCHSSYAALPSNSGQPLSRYILDKGVELNPGNASYHPISAPGTNGTTAMSASLVGTSPYKLWNFNVGDTVRCMNCHADARLVGAATQSGTTLAADATLSIHASPERDLLIAAYRDRVLKGPLDGYNAVDFALCFVCHSEAPFVDTSGEVRADTNFRFHGLHVSGAALINHGNDATNVDQPGDGSGLAICAECHFRIHSTAFPVNGQPSGPRLVDFAPNVSGGLTPTSWTARSTTTAGTCALKCHGQPHNTQY